MERQHTGAPKGTDQPGASQAQRPKATTSQPSKPKAPTYAAFGTTGGAAIMFHDLASI